MRTNRISNLTRNFMMPTAIMILAWSFYGCRNPDTAQSRVKFTVADRNAKNVALIIGSPNDLTGVFADVKNVSALFKQQDLGYEQEVINHATRSQILNKASEISARLTPDSTVFFYYSGHGAETGELATEGMGSVTMREVANSFGSKLAGGKFKRFIAVIDSCFSGQNAVGSGAMFLDNNSNQFSLDSFLTSLTTGQGTGLFGNSAPGFANSGSIPFVEGLVLAASRPSEESGDGDGINGGTFTSSLLESIRQNKSSSLQQILENAKKITVAKSFGTQTPVWKAMPESMLQEKFDRRDNISGSNGNTGAPKPNDQPEQNSNQSNNATQSSNSTVITVGDTPTPGKLTGSSAPQPSNNQSGNSTQPSPNNSAGGGGSLLDILFQSISDE